MNLSQRRQRIIEIGPGLIFPERRIGFRGAEEVGRRIVVPGFRDCDFEKRVVLIPALTCLGISIARSLKSQRLLNVCF